MPAECAFNLESGLCVNITGSDAVSVASGFHYYLKYTANCSVSWWGDQLSNLPSTGPVPLPQGTIHQSTTYRYRYYMNVCTHGYSTFAWFALTDSFLLLVLVNNVYHVVQGLEPMGTRDRLDGPQWHQCPTGIRRTGIHLPQCSIRW